MKLSALYFRKGFTLVELLVVIAIIGILAAALVATIDPLEQIKKSQDTTNKNTAVEYLNALTRYYGTHQKFPWDPTVVPTPCTDPTTATTVSGMSSCTGLLVTDGELKNGFINAQGLEKIFVTRQTAPNDSVTVCFAPVSKSQQKDPLSIYEKDGSAWTTGDKYWCAQ